jgi:hypothetical protein
MHILLKEGFPVRIFIVHTMSYKTQHDDDNELFTPGIIESMHFISAEEVVKIGIEVVTKITREYSVKKGFEIFDENKAPLIQRELKAIKIFLISDDVVKFMNRKSMMDNREEIVQEFEHLVSMLFLQVFLYIYTSMVKIRYIDKFRYIAASDPVDWIVEHMVAKFSQSNYIFRRSGKDIKDGLWIL